MNNTQKENLILTIVLCFVVFNLVGVWIGAKNGFWVCTYSSILSRVNVGYILGCELTKPRWESNQ
jgi:hypothetical protein